MRSPIDSFCDDDQNLLEDLALVAEAERVQLKQRVSAKAKDVITVLSLPPENVPRAPSQPPPTMCTPPCTRAGPTCPHHGHTPMYAPPPPCASRNCTDNGAEGSFGKLCILSLGKFDRV